MISQIRKHLKQHIDNKCSDWDLTIALRYLPIVADLKKAYRVGESILEVGSGSRGITPYLGFAVTGIDTNFDTDSCNKLLMLIKGSAVKLIFPNKSFDYVVSVDMLEHIPNDKKVLAVEEMIRVARKKIYLAFPSGKEAEETDRVLNDWYFQRKGVTYPFLAEHIKIGLPELAEVLDTIKKYPEWEINQYNNTNIKLWTILLKMGLSDNKTQASWYRRLLLFLPILKYFNFGTTYRKLLILKKYG